MGDFSGGSGTLYSPFLIANKSDFETMFLDEYRTQGYYFKQTANIDFESVFWEPTGHYYDAFTGDYDGNNKIISNLTTNYGLFPTLNSGSVIRVTVQNGILTDIGENNIFGFIAPQCTNSHIAGCNVSGSGSKSYSGAGAAYGGVGGVCGGATNSLVEYNISDVTLSAVTVAGIVGTATNSMIRANYSKGTITASCIGGGIVGGVLSSQIIDCFSECNIQGGQSYSFIGGKGGIAGYLNTAYNYHDYPPAPITRCFSTGDIIETGGSYDETCAGVVGGVNRVGDYDFVATLQSVSNCVALNETIYSSDYAAGIVSAVKTIPETSVPDPITMGTYQRSDMLLTGSGGVSGAAVESSVYNGISFWRDTLGFDFTTVWDWDLVTSLPKLLPYSYVAPIPPIPEETNIEYYSGIYPMDKPTVFTGRHGVLSNWKGE